MPARLGIQRLVREMRQVRVSLPPVKSRMFRATTNHLVLAPHDYPAGFRGPFIPRLFVSLVVLLPGVEPGPGRQSGANVYKTSRPPRTQEHGPGVSPPHGDGSTAVV